MKPEKLCKICQKPIGSSEKRPMVNPTGDAAHERCVHRQRNPITLAEISATFREGLALYEGFRRLGFAPEDIHAGDLHGTTFAIAVLQDGIPYAVPAGPLGEGWEKEWRDAAEWWNRDSTSNEERSIVWSEARIQAPGAWVGVLADLAAKGLKWAPGVI